MKMYCRTSGAGALLWLAMVLPATGLACTPASAAAAEETAADGTLPAADPPRQVAVRTRSCPQPLSLRGSLDLGSHSVQNRDGGGYLRAVLPLSSQLYLFGGVDRMSRRLPRDATRLKVVIDQGELGLGARLPLSARLGLVAEASALRLATTLEFQHQQYPQLDFRQREQFPAAKVMVSAHALPLAQLELWAKAGYLRVADNRRIGDSEVLSAGALYRLDARWGVLGEVERYKQLRFYRLGLRATF